MRPRPQLTEQGPQASVRSTQSVDRSPSENVQINKPYSIHGNRDLARSGPSFTRLDLKPEDSPGFRSQPGH